MVKPTSPCVLRSDLAISFVLFGSYFPAWVACLISGLFLTGISHVALRQTGMLTAMPLLPVFYLLTSIFGGMATWLMFFAGGVEMSMFEPEISARRRLIATLLFVIVAAGAIGSSYAVLSKLNNLPRTTDASIEAEILHISAGLPGRIDTLAVQENDSVSEGQLLFKLEDTTYRLLRDQSQAHLDATIAALADTTRISSATEENAATAKAEIDRAQTNLNLAEATVARLAPLAADGITSQQSLDVARTAAADAKVSLVVARQTARAASNLIKSTDALEAEVRAARAALALAELNLSRTEVRALFDGNITGLTITEGTWVLPEAPIFTLIDTHSWHAVGFFRETELAAITAGQPVRIRVQSNPNAVLNGQVNSIGWGILSTDGVTFGGVLPFVPSSTNWVRLAKRFPVRISLDGDFPDWLRVGASATLALQPIETDG